MTHLMVQAVKYVMILLFLLYTYSCFHVFVFQHNVKRQKHIYHIQHLVIYVIHALGYLTLYLNHPDIQLVILYGMQVLAFSALYLIYHLYYRKASHLVLNNMIIFLVIGLIMLTRLNLTRAFKQTVFMYMGMAAAAMIPAIMHGISIFRKLKICYALTGILALLTVAIMGNTSYGAKLNITVAGFSFQPSEFVKILFVFYVAASLYMGCDRRQFFRTSYTSAVFVLLLVASKDLGGALLFFFTYLVMIYVATEKKWIFAGGLGFMCLASFGGFLAFTHVQNRVAAWFDPLANYAGAGNQVSQGLFGIGTGGWFGLGLGQGLPSKIPVATSDFIFAAISEEMGGIVALCIILICISMFLMIFNVSMRMDNPYYRLVALGLGAMYSLQTCLNIGGVIRFIPSTGVTLPLVSYGGSSLLTTMLTFGIIQALYIRQNEERAEEKREEQVVRAIPGIRRSRTKHTGAYNVIAYFYSILFLGMVACFSIYMFVGSNTFINSIHNPLQDLAAERVIRGDIYSADGRELAYTSIDKDGKETRVYPYDNVFAHAIGYAVNGKAGVENRRNFSLLSSHIFFPERIQNDLMGIRSQGDDVYTTLDTDLQQIAWKALGSHNGAVVAMEPQSGRILCLVSKKDYNPNTMEADWTRIVDSDEAILFNRATAGRYTPGSVFKIVTLLAYYREHPKNYNDFTYTCTGSVTAGNTTIHCAGGQVHGEQTLTECFANSCNCAFVTMGLGMKPDSLQKSANKLLFNTSFPLEYSSTRSFFSLGSRASEDEIMQKAMGQGDTYISPIHICMVAAGIANGGVIMQPYVVDRLESVEGLVVSKTREHKLSTILTAQECDFMRANMKEVVEQGTASSLSGQRYAAFGKTGTAEISSGHASENAWFTGWAELDGKQIAVAVIVEDSGAGSKYAVPIARKLFNEYFK